MAEVIVHIINQESFFLYPCKLMFWKSEETVILSDIHIGKASHFRKNGIGITASLFKAEIEKLENCILKYNPQKVIIVGDLFHSYKNNEVELFGNWIKQFQYIEWHLVKGNHDILPENEYSNIGIATHLQLQIKNIVFTHELPQKAQEHIYYITGHIHPSIKVAIGKNNQKTLPCFFFGQQHAILPSFGLFTGTHTVKPTKKDCVYAITPHALIKV